MAERHQAGYHRIEVWVPRTLTPDLMKALGTFAANHELGVMVDEQRDGGWSVDLEADPQSYNPELVEWVTGEENASPVPVVTLGKLRILADQSDDFQRAQAARTIAAVSRNLEGGEAYLHGHHKYPIAETAGFRADLFSDLVSRLISKNEGEEAPRNIGEVSLRFLQLVNENLWVPAENQQGSI